MPQLLSALALLPGVMLIFSSVTPTPDQNLEFLSNYLPLPIVEGAHFLSSLLGLALGSLCHGVTATSVISGSQGGGKTVILKLIVDGNVMMAGLIFTLIMGRLGGLIPAISATRLKLLDALR